MKNQLEEEIIKCVGCNKVNFCSTGQRIIYHNNIPLGCTKLQMTPTQKKVQLFLTFHDITWNNDLIISSVRWEASCLRFTSQIILVGRYTSNHKLKAARIRTRITPENLKVLHTKWTHWRSPPQYSSSSKTGSICCSHFPLYNSNNLSAGVTPAK